MAVIVIVAGCHGDYWGTSGYYRGAELDSKSLKLRVSDYVGLSPPAYRAFFRFTDGRGRHQISDCEPEQQGQPQVCYNFFTVDADDRLAYRTKYLRLLSGPYGSVDGIVTYFYAAQYSRQKNTLETRPGFESSTQIPPVVSNHIDGLEKMLIAAVSLVRIFRAPPQFLIVSANYSSEGHLYELHVYGTKDGSVLDSHGLAYLYSGEFAIATTIGDDQRTRTYFGLPERFPLSDYMGGRAQAFASSKLDPLVDVVNLHYDESRVVRQDSYVPGEPRATVFLTFPPAKEDEALRPVDRQRGFADIDDAR